VRKKLQKARNEKELFQLEVAKIINVSERHYRRLESGASNTSGDNWIKLYDLFDGQYPLQELMKNTTQNGGEKNETGRKTERKTI